MSVEQNVLLDIKDRVAVISLNRPDALNATTDALYSELAGIIREVAGREDVGCVILTGEGRGFCAGADLKARRDDMTPLERRERHRWILRDILYPLFQLEKPVIAAVNGPAAGAGMNLALACDFVIASDKASFVQAFAKVGLVPDLGGLWFLARVVGINRAKELCFTARKVGAEEALALGIANKLVPHEQLIDETIDMARAIASGSPTAQAMTKSLLNRAGSVTLDQMLDFESFAQTVAYLTPEYEEGVKAFREKRSPDFAAAAAAARR